MFAVFLVGEVIGMKRFLKEHGRFLLMWVILGVSVFYAEFWAPNYLIGCLVLVIGVILGVVALTGRAPYMGS